jgi:hypothetical protein
VFLNTCLVANCTLSIQHGLKGNRAVSGSVWSVVTAATRAFPIQLSPSVDKAQTVAEGCAGADLVQTWVLQVIWCMSAEVWHANKTKGCFLQVLQCDCACSSESHSTPSLQPSSRPRIWNRMQLHLTQRLHKLCLRYLAIPGSYAGCPLSRLYHCASNGLWSRSVQSHSSV